jgi:hypothetical protein
VCRLGVQQFDAIFVLREDAIRPEVEKILSHDAQLTSVPANPRN